MADEAGSTAYSYDGLGRLTAQTWSATGSVGGHSLGGHSFTTSWTWAVGPGFEQVDSVTYPSGRTVTFALDGNRLAGLASAGATLVTGRTYRADGQLTGQAWGNGLTEARTFDLAGRATGWSLDGTGGGSGSVSISRDAVGNPLAITTTGALGTPGGGTLSQSFTHDQLDRLTAEPGQAYAYDPNGNRLSDAAGSYGVLASSNRLSSSPAGPPAHHLGRGRQHHCDRVVQLRLQRCRATGLAAVTTQFVLPTFVRATVPATTRPGLPARYQRP